MTGGRDGNDVVVNATYFHDFESSTWNKGPGLKQGRCKHGCAAFGSGIPIVAGGYGGHYDDYFDSVELLVNGK